MGPQLLELGGPLFHRERDRTHLTELGRTVFDQTKMAKQLSQELAQGRKSILRLGIMSTISPDEIVDLIASLRERHPGLDLKLCDANASELRAKLLAGDLDVVIYALPGEEPDEGIHKIPLFREKRAGVPSQRARWRILYSSHELRIRGLCGQHSPRAEPRPVAGCGRSPSRAGHRGRCPEGARGRRARSSGPVRGGRSALAALEQHLERARWHPRPTSPHACARRRRP